MTGQHPISPDQALDTMLIRHEGLAHRVNALAAASSVTTSYGHTSVARWIAGAAPRKPVPQLIAAALSERAQRPVTVEEIGISTSGSSTAPGWDLPPTRRAGVTGALQHRPRIAPPGPDLLRRAVRYVSDIVNGLSPWGNNPKVRDFTQRHARGTTVAQV